ncbi:glycosyltransferase (plasmid) [Methylobacterium sp. NMS14P]|uniref:glycosyltransferase n=1 Tax=Methylobacterium sp. NMS14P TaxID=2894310 RepID=UPI00235A104A|nr:glycosyltransferase [Methylobacterium sp. NMS14P]WCS28780.1 glycosyltransferase [Methylobacterium sp. NMS14P]
MPYEHGISVVIATHNGSAFVREQLHSLVTQTVPPLEIIVSDDNSIDNTLQIVQEFTSLSNIPFRIFRNSTALGFRDNFLRGALRARGHFVAFCDQDDIWDSTKIAMCTRYIDDRAVSMIAHTALCVDASNRPLRFFSQGISRDGVKPPLSYDPWLTFFGFSIVFRRDLLDLWDIEDRFTDFIVPGEKIAHDRWVTFLAQIVGQVVEVDVPLVRYRQHGNNLFGDGKRARDPRPRTMAGGSDPYREATAAMIGIVMRLPDATTRTFPLFDRARAVGFLQRALHQLEARENIYRSASRLDALRRLAELVTSGTYCAVHDGTIRWRSIAKDLKFTLVRR